MDALFSPRSVSVIGYVPRKELLWLAAVFSGIVMCYSVYKIAGLMSLLCFDGYRKLKNMDKVEWKNRGFSTFHAIIVSSASLYLLLFSDLFKEDSHDQLVVNRTSIVSETILGVSIGYFLSDLAMIVWHFPALGGWEYVLHHGLSMFSIFLSIVSGQGQIYILMVLFSESTTPFVNLRWLVTLKITSSYLISWTKQSIPLLVLSTNAGLIRNLFRYLDIYGQKSSNLYICNGIFLFLGWLFARILLFIFFFTHMLIHFDQVKEIFDLGFYSLLLVPSVLAIMNLFWFWKIAKGLVKTLSKKRHRQ